MEMSAVQANVDTAEEREYETLDTNCVGHIPLALFQFQNMTMFILGLRLQSVMLLRVF